MNLEIIMLGQRKITEYFIFYMIPLTWISRIDKISQNMLSLEVKGKDLLKKMAEGNSLR